MLCFQSDHLGEECYKIVRKLEVGDIVGVSGGPFRTKTGELTIDCAAMRLPLTRSTRPLPEKYHGPQAGHGDALPATLC